MIRLYPTHLQPSAPVQVLPVHGRTIAEALRRAAPSYRDDGPHHRLILKMNGEVVPAADWATTPVTRQTDIDIYPKPGDPVTAILAVVAVVSVAALYMALNQPKPGAGPGQGRDLPLRGVKGNRVRLGDPVRELLGAARVYPDLIMPVVQRFESKRSLVTTLCGCVGAGNYNILPNSLQIGSTPASAFGTDVQSAIYQPGQSVAADPRAIIWHPCSEVGATTAGGAGLDLASTAPAGTAIAADAVVLGGHSISLAGTAPEFPPTWSAGTIVYIETPASYTVREVGGYSRIEGALDDLAPFVGQKVTLLVGADNYPLTVASVSPYVAPVPGAGGQPSEVLASAAPATYDFEEEPAVWTLTYQGIDRTVSLAANYINMSGLVAEITSQLAGIGLVAQDNAGRLRLVEPSSPYKGGAISQSGAPVRLFGTGATSTVGTPSAGGSPEAQAFITLRYDTGEPFVGLPTGTQRIALGYRGLQFRLDTMDGQTATFTRLTDAGVLDTGWAGWTSRTLLDFRLNSDVSSGNWLGPYMATEEGDLTDYLEYDFWLPAGLCRYNDKGRTREYDLPLAVEWRDAALGGAWTSVSHRLVDWTEDAIGHTFGLQLPYPMRPQVRVRRLRPIGGTKERDQVYWFGLRARLPSPASYPGVTIMTASVRGGDRLAAQSNRMVSVFAERVYATGAARSIRGAYLHFVDSLGISRARVDEVHLAALDAAYWTPRNERYDMAHERQGTARDVLQGIMQAGMGHLCYSGSLISGMREGVQPLRGVITPLDATAPLRATFRMRGPDDFTGVDVKYLSVRGTEEVVRCRLPGLAATKIDTISPDGVSSRTQAWRIGMRTLRKHVYQRWTYSGETEMDARVHEYRDHVTLADDQPGTSQTVEIHGVGQDGSTGLALLQLSDPLDWSLPNPLAIIRRHDGSATSPFTPQRGQTDDEVLAPPAVLDFELLTDDPHIEPPRLLYGTATRIGYPAMLVKIKPDSDGKTSFEAEQYDPIYYADDNNVPA